MAIDTAQKRFSIMHLSMPWRGPAVVPTGTVDAAERVAFLNYYSGIALAPPGGVVQVARQLVNGGVVNRGLVNAGRVN